MLAINRTNAMAVRAENIAFLEFSDDLNEGTIAGSTWRKHSFSALRHMVKVKRSRVLTIAAVFAANREFVRDDDDRPRYMKRYWPISISYPSGGGTLSTRLRSVRVARELFTVL